MQKPSKKEEPFLESNGKRPEVVTLKSGLQYEVIREGNGPVPTANNTVKVHYHGTLIDGTVFDSSVRRGEPAAFGVTQVISGCRSIAVDACWFQMEIIHSFGFGLRRSGAGQHIYSLHGLDKKRIP